MNRNDTTDSGNFDNEAVNLRIDNSVFLNTNYLFSCSRSSSCNYTNLKVDTSKQQLVLIV